MNLDYEIRIIDFQMLNCPICINKIIPRVFLNANLPIGLKIPGIDIHLGDSRNVSQDNFFGVGKSNVPNSIILRKKIFMNREIFESIAFEYSAFDEWSNEIFRRKYLNIR